MRRLLLGGASLVLAAILVIAASTLTARRASVPDGAAPGAEAYPIPPDVARRLEGLRVALEPAMGPPGITRERAIALARDYSPSATATDPVATYAVATSTDGAATKRAMQRTPIWIVLFEGTTISRSGPPDSSIPKRWRSDTYVLLDAGTGKLRVTVDHGTAPLAESDAA